MSEDTTLGVAVKKADDFSEWFTQLMQKAELADVRYDVKGFPVYREWAVISMRKMARKMEELVEKHGHLPIHLPLLIPAKNFELEADHIKGFAPDVFWVTHGGDATLPEKLALKPTGETAFYQMYALWLRSHNQLPYKRYQTGTVYRHESKNTRPFWRTRELYWMETHCAHLREEDAKRQLVEDMSITKSFLQDWLAVPYIFFERPQWDKFPGAEFTFAADALLDSGRVSQLPSTHHLGTGFSKAFGVSVKDEQGKDVHPYLTCYGPCFSRIYGVLIAIHGDDKGLVLPFDIAPVHIVIVPIIVKDQKDIVLKKCEELRVALAKKYEVRVDAREDVSLGFKCNEWELKGVPLRIEVGPRDLKHESAVVFRRDLGMKEPVPLSQLNKYVNSVARSFTKNLLKKQKEKFVGNIVSAKSLAAAEKAIAENKIARVMFCSMGKDGAPCAEPFEKQMHAYVRGTKALANEQAKGTCITCGKPAKHVVYVARSY